MIDYKTIQNIVLAGTLAASGCYVDHSHYSYTGKIGEDVVQFDETWGLMNANILTVIKSDGNRIKYVDCLDEDLKLEVIEIIPYNGNESKQESQKEVLEQAQREFDHYLEAILQSKQSQ
ncbi:MAG: hypothetical protein Q8R37_02720 [Nanoarchaeota archaeon]|nr:hypothetical protein [Nanoarchaeota archaeon]